MVSSSMEKRHKFLAVWSICAVILVAALMWNIWGEQSKEKENEKKYTDAIQMIECGAYEDALKAFQELGYYKDSISYFLEVKLTSERAINDYNYASDLFDDHQYQDAIEVFEELGNFKDSKEKIDTIRNLQYADASTLFNNGNYEQAYKAFFALGDYKDSKEQAELSKNRMSQDETQELLYQAAYKEYGKRNYRSALNQFTQLQDYKDSMSMAEKCQRAIHQNYQTIAAGVKHSVAIQSDGRILYTGSNEYNQCNISDWTNENIVSVDCGGVMTIGLKDNGKVLVATNHSDFNEHKWEQWEDIVAVSAGYAYVVGLKQDGTVVGEGHDAGDGQLDINSWENIVAIATGWRHTVGLAADGTIYITGYKSSSQLRQIANHKEDWSDIIAIAAGGGDTDPSNGNGHTVGLKSDGTVVAVGDNTYGQCNVNGWADVVAIAAGDSHTVGLQADGTVLTTGKYETNLRLGDKWTNVVAISAGTEFTLGLGVDGIVIAEGYNLQNQIPKLGAWTDVLFYSGWTSVTGLDVADKPE